jgi:hypothetical protein
LNVEGIAPVLVNIGLAIILLSWLILIISKVIFGKFFISRFWKNAFIIIIPAPSLIQLYWVFLDLAVSQMANGEDTYVGLSSVQTNFMLTFLPLFVIFFIAYFIYFMMRLMRYRDEKIGIAKKNRQGG